MKKLIGALTGVCLIVVLALVRYSTASPQDSSAEQIAFDQQSLAAFQADQAKAGLVAQGPTWTRSAFEAGVQYGPADQIGLTTTNCPGWGWAADWYAHAVSWTTGAPGSPTTSSAVPKTVFYNGQYRTVVFNGTYSVFANNYTFDTSLIGKTTTATITLRLHCLDGTYPYVDLPAPQSVSIFDRIPMDKINAPKTVKGGTPFTLEMILTAAAPPSNTRVDLKWQGAGLPLIGAVPNYVDVPAVATSTTLTVPTSLTKVRRDITITATTKVSKQITVTIIP